MKKVTVIILVMLLVFKIALANDMEKKMKIKITIDDNLIVAELNNTDTARDLLSKLPLTLQLNKHQNREYYTGIKLDKTALTQNGYQVGDIGYWTAGNSLVFFYGRGSTDGLIIMGKITQGLELLSKMDNAVSAHIEVF